MSKNTENTYTVLRTGFFTNSISGRTPSLELDMWLKIKIDSFNDNSVYPRVPSVLLRQ
jgi:hypothetical protein